VYNPVFFDAEPDFRKITADYSVNGPFMARGLLLVDGQSLIEGRIQPMFRPIVFSLPVAVLLFANGARADSHEDKLREYLPQIQSALIEQDVVKTLRNYNETRRDMTRTEIDGLEKIWQAELGSMNRPLITGTVRNVTALRMRKVVRNTGRIVTEINLLDARGLSVAQTSIFPRIWAAQTETLMNVATVNPELMRVGEIASDGPNQSRRFEAVVPVADPDTDELIGSVILVVDAEALESAYPDRTF
jgi:hypothetical protein